jgi:DNA-binding SARP family transcriptional activator
MLEDERSGAAADVEYAVLFESAWRYIETNYHGLDAPEANIGDCLASSLTLYDADLAFILELDEELEACQYLYVKARDGFDPRGRQSDETLLFSNLFTDIIRRDEPFSFTADALKTARPEEYRWLSEHGIESAMAVPFKTRTGLVAFFGVHNARRFQDKTSFLTLSTKALANEIRALRMTQLNHSRYYSPELCDDDVVIKLFGGFDIYTNLGSLSFSDISSVQCGRFLLYLLKNRNRTIPVREIADVLWPDQLIDNPYAMVKGVAFRVRKILDSICPQKLVVAKYGTYAVSDKLTLIIDTEEFDQLCDRARSSKLSAVDRQLIFEKLLRVYKGDMLPNHESEIWLMGWIGYYQMKYLEILKEYLSLLRETAQYGKIFEVVSNVLSICYDDGEVYAFLIDALMELRKPELAKSYYLRIEKLLTPEQRRSFLSSWNDCKNKSIDLSKEPNL